jgi:hypothetical protein
MAAVASHAPLLIAAWLVGEPTDPPLGAITVPLLADVWETERDDADLHGR